MLDKLFGSNARVKLLQLFLFHDQTTFFIREISRQLGLQLNSVRRELTNLEKMGILIVESKGDKKFYQVDKSYLLFNELKALFVKSQMLHEKNFTDKLKKMGDVRLLILTGIFINNPDSAVDMFIVGDLDKARLGKVVKELEDELLREINYVAMTSEDFNYRREVTDVFLYNILEGKKVVIIDQDSIA